MGISSNISWCDSTWNPWQGCHKVSQGCKNCYMFTDKARYGQQPDIVVRSKDATFYAPLEWEKQATLTREPHRVFTCSWSDFFIEEADAWRPSALLIMARTPHLTYQILTKRPERIQIAIDQWNAAYHGGVPGWPFPNVWLGVSVENQATADERIPWLLKTPAALRFVSYEPALGPVDFTKVCLSDGDFLGPYLHSLGLDTCLDWIICGGESGSRARPCNLAWLRSVVKQCQAAGVACFVKQLGSKPYEEYPPASVLGAPARPLRLAGGESTVALQRNTCCRRHSTLHGAVTNVTVVLEPYLWHTFSACVSGARYGACKGFLNLADVPGMHEAAW